MEIGILRNMGRPTDNNADRPTGSLTPPKPESGKGSKTRRGQNTSVKLGSMKWISRLLILIVLALGYMCLQSAGGPGRLLFVCYNLALLLLWGLHELQHPLDEKSKG